MIHTIQAYVDGMNAEYQRGRAATQMTLGGLIEKLEAMDPITPTRGFGRLSSYRGYYNDLAFEPDDTAGTVAGLLRACREAMGRVFQGYKGGDYQMGENTPLWMSPWGDASGERLIGLRAQNGALVDVTEQEES